jgi:hypothetical protein
VWCSADSLPTRDTVRRIRDAVGVDPTDFESGYPKLV